MSHLLAASGQGSLYYGSATVLAVLSIIALVATALAVGFSRYRKASLDVLRQTNADLTDRCDTLEGKVSDLEKEHEKDQKRLEQQDSQIADLREMVTGVRAIKDLRAHVDGRFDEVLAAVRPA